jgi:F0F1-type ATP synthase assembly protein I
LVIIAIFSIVVSKWFSGLFASTSFGIIVLSIPSYLITAWVFSKYRLKQMRVNN